MKPGDKKKAMSSKANPKVNKGKQIKKTATKSTAGSDRVLMKVARERDRAVKWGNKLVAKSEKKISKLSSKPSSESTKSLTVSAKEAKAFGSRVASDRAHPTKRSINAVAGRDQSGKLNERNKRQTTSPNPGITAKQQRSNISQAKRVKKANTKKK